MYEVLNQGERSTEEYDTLSNNPTDQYVFLPMPSRILKTCLVVSLFQTFEELFRFFKLINRNSQFLIFSSYIF